MVKIIIYRLDLTAYIAITTLVGSNSFMINCYLLKPGQIALLDSLLVK